MQATSEILTWGIQEIITEGELNLLLASERPLNIKLGVDPTSPDLHLGHAVVLRKLKQFQELGHQCYLVIGDFTASIGDPSGRQNARPVLSEAEIRANMETYLKQAELVLDVQNTHIIYNSEWLQPLTLGSFIGTAMQVSLNTLIEREDFANRLKNKESVGFHELFYPIVQGIDSVHLEIDVEIGGWDQRLNMLMGRELQKKLGKQPQAVICMKPLLGLDGVKKMSKSFGNYVGLSEPADQMFGKLMRIPDSIIKDYAVLAAVMDDAQVKKLEPHPREAKAEVAAQIVALYHGQEVADQAESIFNKTFRDKQLDPSLVKKVDSPDSEITVIQAVVIATHESSSEARRLIEQGAVRLGKKVANNPTTKINLTTGPAALQIGKHRFYELHYKGKE
ncbi:MAG TPA: tyrosine--tRNA ligase [Candidatus Saccharimonadales bacterium]|nr:tyrosine--tRNA ligase [Candidatus Saccharimonadales bacterium]